MPTTTKSRIVFEGHGYTVCLTRAGLSVQRGDKGKVMPPTHPQFNDYVEAFDTAMDAQESRDLCRALLS